MIDHGTLSRGRRDAEGIEVKPRARSGLIARTVGEELVVYDPQTHVAQCLNRTAALVFQAADGCTSVAELSAELQRRAQVEVPHDVVWATLEKLAEAGLLEEQPPARPQEPSRRSAIRAVGVAALAPIVASLVVPTPAEA